MDLGLPSGTLWATCNLGAENPYEAGDFFAWGELEPKEFYQWENYSFFQDWIYDPEFGEWPILEDIGLDISGTEYDAAVHQWGNGWRLPNEQERYELLMLCWSNGLFEENGVWGARVTGPNEHNIYLPLTGLGVGPEGYNPPCGIVSWGYWTGCSIIPQDNSPINPTPAAVAIHMQMYMNNLNTSHTPKSTGLNIRPVINPKDVNVNGRGAALEYISAAKSGDIISFNDGVIKISESDSAGAIMIYDLSGRLLQTSNVNDGGCDVSEWAKGLYIVTYYVKGREVARKKIVLG